MTIELMVRYERAPDLETLKTRVESCLQQQLGLSELPKLAYVPGMTGEHAHEINVFLDGDEDTRTWLLIGPSERLDDVGDPVESWATVASMHTPKSLLLTLVTAAMLADLAGEPITDDALLFRAERKVSPLWLVSRLKPYCRGHSFGQAAEATEKLLGPNLDARVEERT